MHSVELHFCILLLCFFQVVDKCLEVKGGKLPANPNTRRVWWYCALASVCWKMPHLHFEKRFADGWQVYFGWQGYDCWVPFQYLTSWSPYHRLTDASIRTAVEQIGCLSTESVGGNFLHSPVRIMPFNAAKTNCQANLGSWSRSLRIRWKVFAPLLETQSFSVRLCARSSMCLTLWVLWGPYNLPGSERLAGLHAILCMGVAKDMEVLLMKLLMPMSIESYYAGGPGWNEQLSVTWRFPNVDVHQLQQPLRCVNN